MTREIVLGQSVTDQFPIWENDGYTKKSGETSFVKRLWKDGSLSSVPVTIQEIGSSGEYKASFTPDAVGFWLLEVTIDYNKDVWQGEYVVDGADLFVNASMSDDGTTSIFGLWFEQDGQRRTDLDSIAAVIKDTEGNLVVDLGTVSSDTGDGVFRFTTLSGNLYELVAYTVIATGTKGSESWIGMAGFTKV